MLGIKSIQCRVYQDKCNIGKRWRASNLYISCLYSISYGTNRFVMQQSFRLKFPYFHGVTKKGCIIQLYSQRLEERRNVSCKRRKTKKTFFGINEKNIKILPVLCAISIIYMLSFSQKMKTNAFLIIFVKRKKIFSIIEMK